jgi:hypothetical protein
MWKWNKNIKNPKWAFMNIVMKLPGSRKSGEILDQLCLASQVLCYIDLFSYQNTRYHKKQKDYEKSL